MESKYVHCYNEPAWLLSSFDSVIIDITCIFAGIESILFFFTTHISIIEPEISDNRHLSPVFFCLFFKFYDY